MAHSPRAGTLGLLFVVSYRAHRWACLGEDMGEKLPHYDNRQEF